MPRLPRPLAAPTIALALIVAGAPLSLLPTNPVSAAVVVPYTSVGREPLAPGVDHDWGRLSTTAGSQTVNLVEVDRSNPAISFEASLSNGRVTGLERTSSQAIGHSAEGHRVIAAINGDVWAGFSNDLEDAPNGLYVEAGELVTAGTAGRPTFGVGPDGRPILGSPLVGITLGTTSAGQFVINRVNQLRRAGETVLYTPPFQQPDEQRRLRDRRGHQRAGAAVAAVGHLDRLRLGRAPGRGRMADRPRHRRRHGPARIHPGQPAAGRAGDPDDDRHPGLGVDPAGGRRT